jgi:NAD+ synthase
MDDEQDKFTDKTLEYLRREMAIYPKQLTEKLIMFIYEHEKRLERNGVIFGLSGGLDSAVLAELCVMAVGTEKTMALLMPEKDSKEEHILDARNIVKRLGIKSKEINMTKYLKAIGLYHIFPLDAFVPKRYRARLVDKSYKYYESIRSVPYFSRTLIGSDTGLTGSIVNRSIAYYRAKHRMRMLLLYMYGERENRLIAGAANKTEYLIGYFVKHGIDSATDIMPIMGLYKTQVIELAKYLSIPAHIIEKAPSPDIISGLVDETAIGLPYEKLDLILLAIEKGWSDEDMEQVLSEINITKKDITYVRGLMRQSEHMRTVYAAD